METMIDLGKMVPDYGEAVGPSETKKKKKSYPTTYVPLDMVRGKEVGSMCRFEIVAKVVGITEREGRDPEAEIDLHSAKYIGKAGKATKEEYTSMSDKEREAHDRRMMDEPDEEDTE